MRELQHELVWRVVQQFKVLLRTHEGTTTSAGVAGGAAVQGLARDPRENNFFLTEAHGQPQEGHVREPAVVLFEGEQHPPMERAGGPPHGGCCPVYGTHENFNDQLDAKNIFKWSC